MVGICAALMFVIAGCGDELEWFPAQTVYESPDAFSFAAVTCAKPSVSVESSEVTLSGLSGAAVISITNGEYQVVGVSGWTTTTGSVTNGSKIKVRHTTASSTASDQMTSTILTIGNRSAAFTSNIGPYMLTSTQTTPACQ